MNKTNKDGDFWDIDDYKEFPEEEKQEDIEDMPYIIEDISTLSHDGRMYTVRIPQRIADLMEIEKGDKIKFRAISYSPDADKDKELRMQLVKK